MTAVTEHAAKQPTGWMKTHTVTGGGGLRLHVREWGNVEGPADPVPPRLVAKPPLLGEAVREHAGRRVPAGCLRSPRPRRVPRHR